MMIHTQIVGNNEPLAFVFKKKKKRITCTQKLKKLLLPTSEGVPRLFVHFS